MILVRGSIIFFPAGWELVLTPSRSAQDAYMYLLFQFFIECKIMQLHKYLNQVLTNVGYQNICMHNIWSYIITDLCELKKKSSILNWNSQFFQNWITITKHVKNRKKKPFMKLYVKFLLHRSAHSVCYMSRDLKLWWRQRECLQAVCCSLSKRVWGWLSIISLCTDL